MDETTTKKLTDVLSNIDNTRDMEKFMEQPKVADSFKNFPDYYRSLPAVQQAESGELIQKSGLAQGESASFTIERKLIGSSDPYTLFTTFVLTGSATGADNPEIRFVSLDPRYYYRVRETGWSWAYEQADPSFLPSTENPNLGNPIVFDNDPDEDTPRHAEAKAVNRMRSFSSSTTTTIHDVVR